MHIDHNAGDANFDLDAAQDRICSGCSSHARPLIGAGQSIGADLLSQAGAVVRLSLSWSAPASEAEALNESGTSIVRGYSLWYTRAAEGSEPPMDGSPGGWTRSADLDSTQTGGYSTDTMAEIEIDLGTGIDPVWVAIGLVYDGSGDPGSDSNSVDSSVISRASLGYLMDLFSDGFETGDTGEWSSTHG